MARTDGRELVCTVQVISFVRVRTMHKHGGYVHLPVVSLFPRSSEALRLRMHLLHGTVSWVAVSRR